MTFAAYAKSSIWDYLLVSILGTALAYTILDGFYILPALQYSPITAVAVWVCTALLYAIAFNRRTTRVGIIAYAVLSLVCLIVAAAVSGGAFIQDSEASSFYFVLTLVLTPVGVFLLSRKRAGTAFLFIIGTFICAWIQFFYERYEFLWLILFVCSALALIIYKNYQFSARTATSVKKLSLSAGFGVSLGAVAAAVGIAVAVWFGIIAPMNPGALQIKLITEYKALETVQVQGTSTDYLTPNMSLTSSKTNSESRTTDDLQRSENGNPTPNNPQSTTTGQQQSTGSFLGVNMDSMRKMFDFQTNTQQAWMHLLWFLLIVLAVVGYFVGRRLWRNRRLKRLQQLPPEEQACALYRFLMGRLGKVGFVLPEGATTLEFARNNEQSMERFNTAGKASFVQLTGLYTSIAYGKHKLAQGQENLFAQYYQGFWKGARKQLGNIRYFFRSFLL